MLITAATPLERNTFSFVCRKSRDFYESTIKYCLSPKAIFTVAYNGSRGRCSFKIERASISPALWTVSVIIKNYYVAIGVIQRRIKSGVTTYEFMTYGEVVKEEERLPEITKFFSVFWTHLNCKILAGARIIKSARCAGCGDILVREQDIDRGFGHKCRIARALQ